MCDSGSCLFSVPWKYCLWNTKQRTETQSFVLCWIRCILRNKNSRSTSFVGLWNVNKFCPGIVLHLAWGNNVCPLWLLPIDVDEQERAKSHSIVGSIKIVNQQKIAFLHCTQPSALLLLPCAGCFDKCLSEWHNRNCTFQMLRTENWVGFHFLFQSGAAIFAIAHWQLPTFWSWEWVGRVAALSVSVFLFQQPWTYSHSWWGSQHTSWPLINSVICMCAGPDMRLTHRPTQTKNQNGMLRKIGKRDNKFRMDLRSRNS